LRSQSVTSNIGRGGRRYLPFVFTEHGALMAANVLNCERAIEMRAAPWAAREKPPASLPDWAFVRLRSIFASHIGPTVRLDELEARIGEQPRRSCSLTSRRPWYSSQAVQRMPNSQPSDPSSPRSASSWRRPLPTATRSGSRRRMRNPRSTARRLQPNRRFRAMDCRRSSYRLQATCYALRALFWHSPHSSSLGMNHRLR